MKKKALLMICGAAVSIPALVAGGIFAYVKIADSLKAGAEQRMTAGAEKTAVSMIEEKYGFTPTVLDTKLERDGMLFDSDYTNKADVLLSDGTRNFHAWVDCSEHTVSDRDDYQLEKIADALAEEISKTIPGGMAISLDFMDDDCNTSRMLSVKYDGNNLREVLSDVTQIELTVGYINADFANAVTPDFVKDMGIAVTLVSFDSQAHRSQAASADTKFYLWNYAPEITGYAYIRKDGIEAKTLSVQNHGDFYTMFDLMGGQRGKTFSAAETDSEALVAALLRESVPRNIEPSTKAYQITSDPETYYIYYPAAQLPTIGGTLQAVETVLSYTDSSGSTITTTRTARIYGDYAVWDVSSAANLRFVLLKPAE